MKHWIPDRKDPTKRDVSAAVGITKSTFPNAAGTLVHAGHSGLGRPTLCRSRSGSSVSPPTGRRGLSPPFRAGSAVGLQSLSRDRYN